MNNQLLNSIASTAPGTISRRSKEFAQFGANFRSDESTKQANDVLGRIRNIEINLIEDLDIVREVSEETGTATRVASVRGVEFPESTRTQTSVAGILGASLSNLSWISYKDMASKILNKRGGSPTARLTYIESADGSIEQPLAVTPVDKDFVDPLHLISKLDPEAIAYNDGSVILTATPTDKTTLSIMGDAYNPSSFLRLPVDGYGDVHRFLGTLRVLCSNGQVLMGSDFREIIKNSNDKFNAIFSSLRTVPTEMIQKLHNRMLAADKTMISGREFRVLIEALVADRRASRGQSVTFGDDRAEEIDQWFSNMLVLERNVLASDKMNLGSILKGDLDILGAVGCKSTVLDTINMITELSTHSVGAGFSTNINVNAAVSKVFSKNRFNLEGKEAKSERRDFWFRDEEAQAAGGGDLLGLAETVLALN